MYDGVPERFFELSLPSPGEISVFDLNEFPEVQIGKDSNGCLVLVLPTRSPSEKVVRLNEIEFLPEQDVCYANQNVGVSRKADLLWFKGNVDSRSEIVFSILRMFLERVKIEPNRSYSLILNEIAELWQKHRALPSPDEIGFWGELFVILSSDTPGQLIDCWSTEVHQSYDFMHQKQALEVKTSTLTIPIYGFSLGQLINSKSFEVVVACVRLIESESGLAVDSLFSQIMDIGSLTSAQRQKLLFRYAVFCELQPEYYHPRKFTVPTSHSGLEFVNFADFPHILVSSSVLDAHWSLHIPDVEHRTSIPDSFVLK